MELNHNQKKYIKKHLKDSSIVEVADHLSIDQKEVLNFLKDRWGKEKLKQFLSKQEKENHQIEHLPPPNFSGGIKGFFSKNWLNLLILAILVFATYANSFDNAFVSDDIAEIRDNSNVGNLSLILTRPFGFIRLVLNWFAFHLAGLNPGIFRLLNIILHLGSVYILYLIVSLLHQKRLAFFSTALFAIHPAISEAVVWISGGTYPQYTFFFLLSFLFYILSKKSRIYYLLSIFCFLFSFMSHPVMPASLPVIFLLYEFCFGSLRHKWVKSIPYFVLLLAYIFVNLASLPEREATLQNVHYLEKGIDNPLIQLPIAITSYLELIFWPKILTLYH